MAPIEGIPGAQLLLEVVAITTVIGTAAAESRKERDPDFDVSRMVSAWALAVLLFTSIVQVLWVLVI